MHGMYSVQSPEYSVPEDAEELSSFSAHFWCPMSRVLGELPTHLPTYLPTELLIYHYYYHYYRYYHCYHYNHYLLQTASSVLLPLYMAHALVSPSTLDTGHQKCALKLLNSSASSGTEYSGLWALYMPCMRLSCSRMTLCMYTCAYVCA